MHVWAINDDPVTPQPRAIVYTNRKSASDAESNYKLNVALYKNHHKDADPPVDGTVSAVEYLGFCPLPPFTIRAMTSQITP